MSRLSFKTFCIENYSCHAQKTDTEVYQIFERQGIMRKEDAIERLKFEKINNQIVFCTEASLACLVYEDCYELEV